eukprot:GHVT01041675.1.p1 GENE.GHVT01041675.1~~GHVT01041675.1.p1  ORF type:complete len:335 (-),score=74.52 GHVT01041675.1:57-950(-)
MLATDVVLVSPFVTISYYSSDLALIRSLGPEELHVFRPDWALAPFAPDAARDLTPERRRLLELCVYQRGSVLLVVAPQETLGLFDWVHELLLGHIASTQSGSPPSQDSLAAACQAWERLPTLRVVHPRYFSIIDQNRTKPPELTPRFGAPEVRKPPIAPTSTAPVAAAFFAYSAIAVAFSARVPPSCVRISGCLQMPPCLTNKEVPLERDYRRVSPPAGLPPELARSSVDTILTAMAGAIWHEEEGKEEQDEQEAQILLAHSRQQRRDRANQYCALIDQEIEIIKEKPDYANFCKAL